ncbi:hypothetical protein [Enterococcus sp.]|uniref:hypothetical protein n=1 Tax=Enterococcus sp. TaxID=35783 RepID=UPI000EB9FB32|nr:hypothetical protein [Enterococcus sp.]HCE13243.1 hypothetical protein [Enterococcus sp.]
MTKICFMLTSNSGIGTTTIFATHARRNIDDLLAYFSEYYNVTANYPEDKDTVDILVIPDSFGAFINERNLPVIKVPTILFLERDFEKIKVYIDNYFLEISKNKIQIDKI